MSRPEPEPIPPPLCVRCSAPWTADMLKAWAKADIDPLLMQEIEPRTMDLAQEADQVLGDRASRSIDQAVTVSTSRRVTTFINASNRGR
jgi:hypothetical protein